MLWGAYYISYVIGSHPSYVITPHPFYVITHIFTSSLFIVRVRTFRPDNGWLIAIFSNVLLKVQRSRSVSPDCVAKLRHPRQICLIDWFITTYFYTTEMYGVWISLDDFRKWIARVRWDIWVRAVVVSIRIVYFVYRISLSLISYIPDTYTKIN